MGPKERIGRPDGPVAVDTNVFVIDLRYPRDRTHALNKRFLSLIAERESGVTTTFNLLEVCGVLSFNLNSLQLTELFTYFADRYRIRVLPVADLEAPLPFMTVGDIFQQMCGRTSLGDALILSCIERYLPGIAALVTWDKEHLEGKAGCPVLTPEEYLAAT